MDPLKYWGLDWLGLSLLVTHAYLLTSKYRRTAFCLGMSGASLMLIFNAWVGSFAGIFFNTLFILIHLRNLVRVINEA
jgi:hypothetical protein